MHTIVRSTYLLGILLLAALCIQAQNTPANAVPRKGVLNEEKSTLLTKEASLGLLAHTAGWGINFRRGKHLTGFSKRVLDFDLITMKHPKEYSSPSLYQNGESYTFGKINQFIIIRSGFGLQRSVYPKQEKGAVEIRTNAFAGLSWGFAKPVYLEIVSLDDDVTRTERADPKTQYPESIYGKSSFFTGIGETKLYPGLYGKFSLSFEYGRRDDDVKMLEVGATIDAYPTAIPIMAVTKNKQIFVNAFVAISWGKKW